MQAEDLIVNEGSKGQVVEKIGEVLPDIGVPILSKAFIIEAVDLCDLT